MAKYTRNTVSTIAAINAELEKVEQAIDDQLDRTPDEGEANQLEATLDMNSNKIINAFTDVDDPDSLLTVGDADGLYLREDGSIPLSGDLDADGNRITGLPNPIDNTEAARKKYVDSLISAITAETGFNPYASYSFSSVQNLKDGIVNNDSAFSQDISEFLKDVLDTQDLKVSTVGYYGSFAPEAVAPSGGANYILTTRTRARAEKGGSWVPDTYGDHYLFGGTEYVAILDNEANVLDVRQMGMLPNFVDYTDNFQAAINRSQNVYVPKGAYTIGKVTATQDVYIHGDGYPHSRLDFKAGETGYMIDTVGYVLTMSNIRLFGGLTSTQKANDSISATRSGLSYSSQNGTKIDGIQVDGFAEQGIHANDTSNGFWERSIVTNSIFKNNYMGINTGLFGEYTRYTDNDITSNYIGIAVRSGNITANDNKIAKNGLGVFLDGDNVNDGHGNFSNNLINHNTYPIFARNIDNGHNFLGNQMFEGIIKIENCTGVMIHGGILNVTEFDLDGTGANYIMNNEMFPSYGNVINASVSNGTLMFNNFFNDGTFLGDISSRTVKAKEVGAELSVDGITEYPKSVYEASVATGTMYTFSMFADGYEWDNNNSTKDYYWKTGGSEVARLDCGTGNYELYPAGAGVILKSPNGTRHKIAVSDAGAITVQVL